MQPFKKVVQLHDLSTRSGIAAKLEQTTSCQTAPTTAMSSTSVDTKTQKKRIDYLFLHFAGIYGHVWRSLYKGNEFLEFTKGQWVGPLQRFEDKVIDKALMSCLSNWEYPPTLPQFIECCRAHSMHGQRNEIAQVIKPASPEVVEANLNKIKTTLNMN